jgi:MFS family permease
MRYRPFQKLVVYNAITLAVFGGCAVLYVNMCRDKFLMKDSDFLLTMVIVNAVFIPCCLYFGKLVDLSGSKPMLTASAVLHIIHFAVWTSVAAGLIPFNWWVITFQSSIWAVGYSMFIIANTRLAMSIVPAMGRSHFFAVFSVSQSIVGGLIPVVWGIMLDSIGVWHGGWAGWSWNSFSIMYALGVGLMVMAILALRVVQEEKTMTTEDFFHEVMVASPTRVIARIFSRNRTPQL